MRVFTWRLWSKISEFQSYGSRNGERRRRFARTRRDSYNLLNDCESFCDFHDKREEKENKDRASVKTHS